MVARAPAYGYQLKTRFESATGGLWPLNVGQVYTTLDRLQRDGMVEPVGADPDGRVQFVATPRGRTEAASWFAEPLTRTVLDRDELVVKVLMAIADRTIDAGAVIHAQRSQLVDELQRRRAEQRRLRRRGNTTDAGQGGRTHIVARLSDDAINVRLEADIRWLDLCDERLRTDTVPTSDEVGNS